MARDQQLLQMASEAKRSFVEGEDRSTQGDDELEVLCDLLEEEGRTEAASSLRESLGKRTICERIVKLQRLIVELGGPSATRKKLSFGQLRNLSLVAWDAYVDAFRYDLIALYGENPREEVTGDAFFQDDDDVLWLVPNQEVERGGGWERRLAPLEGEYFFETKYPGEDWRQLRGWDVFVANGEYSG